MGMRILLSVGVMASILLFFAFYFSARRAKKVSIFDRVPKNAEVSEPEKKKDGYIAKLKRDLEQGRSGITIEIYFLIMIVSAAALFALTIFLVESTAAGVVVASFAFFVPREVVSLVAENRRREFDLMFAKALKRMSAGLRTSSTLAQCVQDVIASDSMPQVLREEFLQVMLDYDYGGDMTQAFYNLYDRTGVEEVKGVAMAIEISAQRGTKLYEAFDSYVEATMEKREGEAEGRAALSGTRTSVNIIAAAPFFFSAVVKFVSPDYFGQIYSFAGGMGRYLFMGVYVFVLIGFYICRKMVNIKL